MFHRLLPLLALVPAIISAYALSEAWFGALALMGYLVGCGIALGPRLSPLSPRPLRLGLGAMATLAMLSLGGSLVYYSATVTTESLLGVLIAVAVLACLIWQPSTSHAMTPAYAPLDLSLFAVGLLALLGWWLAILSTSITEPTRSVWLILDPFILVAVGVAIICTLTILLRNRATLLAIILLAGTLFSVTAVAASVYNLGYGFDPFLHRATVAHIAEYGTITPKPLYYIGQYSLELIAVKIFALPLFNIDALLAPLLAGFGLVIALANRHANLKAQSLMLASLLFLPLAAFIQTTPQALAFIFTGWALFSSPRHRLAPAVFALAAIATHPLAGIGAGAYVLLLMFDDLPVGYKSWRLAGLVLTTMASALAIPMAFVVQAKLSGLTINFDFSNVWKLWRLPLETYFTTNYNAWGDTAYFFIGNAFIIVCALALIGLVLTPKTSAGWYVPGLIALAMFINFVIISLGFDFTFLITYERLDFALRLLTLTTLFLLPYVAVLLTAVWKKLLTAPLGLRVGLVVVLTIMFVSNVYAAYPRHDNYARSSGFNVGSSDFDTVTAIEQSAQGQDYIVLSNQALAAAAVQVYGFKQYYSNDIFFYPIPTGGPLYQHYLTLVEDQPSLDTVQAAMTLTGVELAYLAVHDYWWQAPQIIENAKSISNDWFAIGDGAVTVFVFVR